MNSSFRNEFDFDEDRLDRHVRARVLATGFSRRTILRGLMATAAGSGALAGLNRHLRAADPAGASIVKPTPANLFRTLGTNRETLFEAFKGRGYLTPASLFFVRNHTVTPVIDAAVWRLVIEGTGVAKPVSYSLDQLKALPAATLVRAVECAGNGRSFFTSQQNQNVAGTAWRLGSIGVAKWKGVRLNTLLNAAGIKKTAVDILPEGLDNPVTEAQGRVRRPLPAARALEDDVLVVYEMNDQPLPADHGFPARLLVPGWIGIANIKWLGRIQVSEEPLFSPWNTSMYRHFGNETDYPGEPALTIQTIKSAFELPFPGVLTAGQQIITGRSWSAAGTIAKVEVSFNDGAAWVPAKIKADGNGHQAWAEWSIPWAAKPGTHFLKARAVDNLGNSQPETVPFNNQGYLFNGVIRHEVTVA